MVLAVIKTILFARRTIILQILPAKIRKNSEKCKFFQKKNKRGRKKGIRGHRPRYARPPRKPQSFPGAGLRKELVLRTRIVRQGASLQGIS